MKTLNPTEQHETKNEMHTLGKKTVCRRVRATASAAPLPLVKRRCVGEAQKSVDRSKHVYSREPWARVMRIHQIIQSGSFPNCTTLAEEFEVATKTVNRDIEFMRSRLDLPIEYDGKRFGYFYAGKVMDFPNVPMTDGELFSLLVASAALAQYQGTPFQPAMETALRKLTGRVGDNGSAEPQSISNLVSFRPFAPEIIDQALFEKLTEAAKERRVIEFSYRKVGGTETERRQVHPYHLPCIENHWYLLGFDVKREAMRTFSFPRIRDVHVTDQCFTLPENFDAAAYMAASFSAYKGADDYELVIEFDRWASDLIRGRQWHRGQTITELPGGMIRLRMRLDSIEEAQRWVLSWGTHATVVRPVALRERIRSTCAELAERYGRHDEN